MLNFTDIINESRARVNYDSVSLLTSEITKYINKVKKEIPKNVQDIIYLTQKYGLMNATDIQEIIDASKSQLVDLSKKFNIDINELKTLQTQLKGLKKQIRLLPQFQTQQEREEIMNGKLATSDLTIDLTTSAGRNAVAKMYTPLVFKIVSKYIGTSSLDRAALISAGMYGLAYAIDNFDKERANGGSFKTFAAAQIENAIKTDITTNSRTVTTNWYGLKNGTAVSTTSLTDLATNSDGDYSDDHFDALAEYDDYDSKDKEKIFAELYKLLESKFSVRDCDIYYRYMGLKDYFGVKQKSKDIAKMYGMSEGNIKNSVINKINKFIKDTPKAMLLMRELRESYEISLMNELIYNMDNKQVIYESLISNDMFIMLEELNRWGNKDNFKNSIIMILDKLSVEESKYFIECLINGFEYIDDTYKKHKKLLMYILKELYPTETFNNKSDVAIINYMSELSEISNNYKIKW
jgi:RNA polymerase sigma factor (sigma-70 family)